jgi:DnaK suppressor protein
VSERAELRDALLAQRGSARQQIADLTADLNGIIESATSVATDDEHDPEGTTIAFERAQLASLLSAAHARIAELDAALARLGAGNYGRCDQCGGEISAERLAARPAAHDCITCAAYPRR